MRTVFLFLGTRGHISDIVHTPYLSYLSRKYRVCVFLPDQMGEGRTDTSGYPRNENIEYIILPRPYGKFWTFFNELFRNELIRRFDDNPAVIWRNKRASNPRRLLLRRLASFIPRNLFSPDFFTFLETRLLPNYRNFVQYAEQYQPSLVLTATPGLFPFDAYAVLCAKRRGVPSVAINFTWDNLTSYPRHIRKTDYLVCWNSMVRKFALSLYRYADKNLTTSGSIRFDQYFSRTQRKRISREEFLKDKGLDPSEKTVLFATNTFGTFHRDFISSFLKWREKGLLGGEVNLFVRIHPHDAMSDFEDFIGLPGVHVEYAGTPAQDDSERGEKVERRLHDVENTVLTLKYSDVCVNIFSTFTLEAFIFNLPVISPGFILGYDNEFLDFLHYRPLREAGAVRLAFTMNELLNELQTYLAEPQRDSAARAQIVERLVRPADGFSYKRSVDFLDKICQS